MEPTQKSIFDKLNSNWITPVLAIITGVYGFMFKMNSDKLDENTKNLNNLKTQIETQLRQKEFENDLKLTIYKEVKDAIVKKDTSIQNATLIVVNEMLKEDTAFREKLKTVLFASPNSNTLIAVQKKIDEFTDEQTLTTTTRGNFTIDVFYLDDIITEAKPRAEQIAGLLRTMHPGYNIRLRLLPKEVNARSGYRISANQIRFEASESKVAQEAYDAIFKNKIFSLEQPKMNTISYRTPNYLSIFVRNM